MAHNYGALSINCGLLGELAACQFKLLGFPGTVNVAGKPQGHLKILRKDFRRNHKIIPVWNPVSILSMALLSIMLTVASMGDGLN